MKIEETWVYETLGDICSTLGREAVRGAFRDAWAAAADGLAALAGGLTAAELAAMREYAVEAFSEAALGSWSPGAPVLDALVDRVDGACDRVREFRGEPPAAELAARMAAGSALEALELALDRSAVEEGLAGAVVSEGLRDSAEALEESERARRELSVAVEPGGRGVVATTRLRIPVVIANAVDRSDRGACVRALRSAAPTGSAVEAVVSGQGYRLADISGRPAAGFPALMAAELELCGSDEALPVALLDATVEEAARALDSLAAGGALLLGDPPGMRVSAFGLWDPLRGAGGPFGVRLEKRLALRAGDTEGLAPSGMGRGDLRRRDPPRELWGPGEPAAAGKGPRTRGTTD